MVIWEVMKTVSSRISHHLLSWMTDVNLVTPRILGAQQPLHGFCVYYVTVASWRAAGPRDVSPCPGGKCFPAVA